VTARTLHRRAARGYTLMELGVVLVLTVLLVFGMVRWLVGIGYSARNGIENATDKRAALVLETIGEDLTSLRHCDPNGADARIVNLAATRGAASMTLVTDPDGDGVTETVTWRLADGDIERGTAAMGTDCAPGEITAWTKWMRDVDGFTLAFLRNGTEDPTGTTGTCTNEYSARCTVAPVQIEIVSEETTEKRVYGDIDPRTIEASATTTTTTTTVPATVDLDTSGDESATAPSATGTFTDGANGLTIERSTASAQVSTTSANWQYISVTYNPGGGEVTDTVYKTSGSDTVGVLTRNSNTSVTAALSSSIPFTLTVKYNGKSSGTTYIFPAG